MTRHDISDQPEQWGETLRNDTETAAPLTARPASIPSGAIPQQVAHSRPAHVPPAGVVESAASTAHAIERRPSRGDGRAEDSRSTTSGHRAGPARQRTFAVRAVTRTFAALGRERATLAFFGVVLVIMTPYLASPPFIDEMDNLLGAEAIDRGGVVYKDFFSQHTPLMYYIMAIFGKLGVSTVSGFRIAFYVLIVAFFVGLFYRYRSTVGTKTLLALPLLFVLDIARNPKMNTVLADMVQAMALLVLYIEFLNYSTRKPERFSRSSIVWISLALFFSVGTAFMSVYAVAMIVLGVVLVEIGRWRQAAAVHGVATPRLTAGRAIVGRYAPLAAALAVLGLIFGAYFAANHALHALVYQSFTFNTEVYSKYLGIASSPTGTLLGGFVSYAGYVTATFSKLYTFSSFVPALLILSNITLCCYLFRKSKALAVTTALFTVFCGIRDYSGFHGTPYVMFSWFGVAFLADRFVIGSKSLRVVAIAACTSVLAFAPSWGAGLRSIHDLPQAFDRKPDYYVQKYTSPNGYFYDTFVDLQTYFDNDVRPASRVASGLVPWFAEAYMPTVISDLEKNKPNVVFYDPDAAIWGHKFKDYSGPLQDLLNRDYVYYPYSDAAETYSDSESTRVWLRKGLGVNQIYSQVLYATDKSDAKMVPAGEITAQSSVQQSFTLPASEVNGVALDVATYSRSNTSHLTVEFGAVDAAGNPKTPDFSTTVDTGALRDNSMRTVRFDHPVSVPAGLYYIRLRTDDGAPGNAVTVWVAQGKSAPGGKLLVNGQESAGEVDFQVMH